MTVEEYIKKAKEECIEAGITDIEDCEEPVKHPLILKHVELFGVEPNCIGIIQTINKFNELLKEVIEKGEPYDEYKMLDEKTRKAYKNGELLL